jgi:hypothetical protein
MNLSILKSINEQLSPALCAVLIVLAGGILILVCGWLFLLGLSVYSII